VALTDRIGIHWQPPWPTPPSHSKQGHSTQAGRGRQGTTSSRNWARRGVSVLGLASTRSRAQGWARPKPAHVGGGAVAGSRSRLSNDVSRMPAYTRGASRDWSLRALCTPAAFHKPGRSPHANLLSRVPPGPASKRVSALNSCCFPENFSGRNWAKLVKGFDAKCVLAQATFEQTGKGGASAAGCRSANGW